MKEFLKWLGMLIILSGVGVLIYYFRSELLSNTYLAISGLLLIGGLFIFIILNHTIDDV